MAWNRVLTVQPEDLRTKVRRSRSPFVIAFVLDNSWSMHVEMTLERTKGIVLDLLRDARTHRDKAALLAFRHNRRPDATICLPLTSSYTLAVDRLRKVPLSGTTPLPDGIRKAYHLLHRERAKYHNAIPVMVIISDGLPNVPIRVGADPYEEVALLCKHLRCEGIATIVVDTEPSGVTAGRSNCRQMAAQSGGVYLPLSLLTRESIERAAGGGGAGRQSAGFRQAAPGRAPVEEGEE
jgi:magnesium chelatase subunit D